MVFRYWLTSLLLVVAALLVTVVGDNVVDVESPVDVVDSNESPGIEKS